MLVKLHWECVHSSIAHTSGHLSPTWNCQFSCSVFLRWTSALSAFQPDWFLLDEASELRQQISLEISLASKQKKSNCGMVTWARCQICTSGEWYIAGGFTEAPGNQRQLSFPYTGLLLSVPDIPSALLWLVQQIGTEFLSHLLHCPTAREATVLSWVKHAPCLQKVHRLRGGRTKPKLTKIIKTESRKSGITQTQNSMRMMRKL